VIPQDNSGRRLAIASMIVVVLLAGSTSLTIWRYQHARTESDIALKARAQDLRAEQASTFFWRERETMNEYLLTPSAALLGELASEYRGFNSALHLLINEPEGNAPARRSQAANRAFIAVFRHARPVAGSGVAEENDAIQELNAGEAAVLHPLKSVQAAHRTEVRESRAEKAQDDLQALVAALIAGVLALGATIGLALFGMRLLADIARRRRAEHELEESRTEFSDMLQATGAEDEAYDLLKRQLERSISDSNAVVFNRNNSEDRLEAATAVEPETGLAGRLKGAEPRSCLAVRFGRRHEEAEGRKPLLPCALCAGSPGHATCEPLLVGGEVIGSVLVMRQGQLAEADRQALAASVAQAGPVLANLRNLAIAEYRAATDALTGLPNSRAVQDTIKRMVAQASRTVSPLATLLLDLDHFKQINDSYGHGCGDDVLAAVAATLEASVRESDFVGRYGGEEFLILLPATGHEDAVLAAEKIRTAVETVTVAGVERTITASIGIAVMPDDAGESVALLRHADRRLYAAKAQGRNRVVAEESVETPVAEAV
jgi:diguanylate cyclase (GGDEF)-like protein